MYNPKSGDLIFATWIGVAEHSHEVMEFLGSTSNGSWRAANFLDRSIVYDFATHKVHGNLLVHVKKFGIHRLNKKLKPKFRIGDIVEICRGAPIWPSPSEPLVCEITQVKLRYDCYKKKCFVGYNLKLLNQNNYNIRTIVSFNNCSHIIQEQHMRKWINYNKIWITY